VIQENESEKNEVRSVILLTDGLANSGVTGSTQSRGT